MAAFPRLAYDDTAIANPEALDKVGAAIKMNGGNAQAITSMIAYLAPQSMSPDAQNLCDELLNQSRTLAGASDAQLGNIDLSRVSGTAAQTIRDQQQLPLNEQQEMYQDFIENVALLWFELWKVYFPMGIEMDGISVSPEEIENILPSVRVDIAEDTSLSKMAAQQELTNLFNNGKLTFAEYVEAYPDHSTISKDVLQKIVANRQMQMMQTMAGAMVGLAVFSCFVVPYLPNLPLVYVSIGLAGFFTILLDGLLAGLVIKGVEERHRTTAMGFYQAVYGLGILLGPVISGRVTDMAGGSMAPAYILSGILTLLTAAVVLLWNRKEKITI